MWRCALRISLITTCILIFCSCTNGENNQSSHDMNNKSFDMTEDLPELEQGYCVSSDDCKESGYCDMFLSICFRHVPSEYLACLRGKGCELIWANESGVLFPSECDTDNDCIGSVFGPHCISNLCYTYEKCDLSNEHEDFCDESTSCSFIGACLPIRSDP